VVTFKRLGVETVGVVLVGATSSPRHYYGYGGPLNRFAPITPQHLLMEKEMAD
jgi:hypothetical protein